MPPVRQLLFWRTKTQQEAREKKRETKLKAREEARRRVLEHPSAAYPPTQVLYTDPSFQDPPPLEYSLRTRWKSITLFWSFVFIDVVCLPITLYFALWYGTHLSHNAVFSISTGALGTVSIIEYFIRWYKLFKKGSNCRVIGARRYYLDFFHWNLSIAWIGIMLELIIGTYPTEPPIRLLAMPASTMCYAFGVQMFIIDTMRLLGLKAPIRISSLPRGSPLRPGIYSIIEDVCAVDGGGGTEFRQRLNLRYQASHYFRQMLHRLTIFWAVGALVIAAATTAIVFTASKDVAYVIGWTLPFAWAAVSAIITTKWVQRNLKHEKKVWHEEREKT